MGRPSNRKRSARRPGRQERARVKSKKNRGGVFVNVPGAGTVFVKLGRKKSAIFWEKFWK